MKKFIKEFIKRIQRPTVYGPIIAFVVSILVSNGTIDLGSMSTEQFVEMILKVLSAFAVIFGVVNNPTNKQGF